MCHQQPWSMILESSQNKWITLRKWVSESEMKAVAVLVCNYWTASRIIQSFRICTVNVPLYGELMHCDSARYTLVNVMVFTVSSQHNHGNHLNALRVPNGLDWSDLKSLFRTTRSKHLLSWLITAWLLLFGAKIWIVEIQRLSQWVTSVRGDMENSTEDK